MQRPAALITGASRGIGEQIARRLAADGFDLTVSARSCSTIQALATELAERHGVTAEAVSADMAVEDDVRALAEKHRQVHGRADVVVLNAGMGAIGAYGDFPVSRLDKMFAVNVRSAYILGQELLPLLRLAGASQVRGGKILAIASTTGVVGEPLNSAYGATKAALISWCETVTTEESEGGVSATAVCPGYVATTMTEHLDADVPWESMMPATDVAELVVGLTRLSRHVVVPRVVLARPGRHLWRA